MDNKNSKRQSTKQETMGDMYSNKSLSEAIREQLFSEGPIESV